MGRDRNTVSDQVLDELKRYTEDLLSFFGLRAAVKISTNNSDSSSICPVEINIADSDISKLLVGHNGRNLNALQHILSSFSKTKWPDIYMVIHVDIGQYRARQIEKLLRMVKLRAEQALESSANQDILGLNSLERRAAHKYISENYTGKLITQSSGEGAGRKLTIELAPR